VFEELIDKTLLALQSTDPESQAEDQPQLLHDEETCKQMEKLIDRELEEIDRKHLEVTMLNEKILESLKMYDSLMKEMPAYMNTPYLKNPQFHEMNPAAMGNQVMGGHPIQMAHPNMMSQQQQYMSFPQSTNGYIPAAALPDTTQAVPPQNTQVAPGPSTGATTNQQPTSTNALPTSYNSIYSHSMPPAQQYNMATSSDSSQPSVMPQQSAGGFMSYNPSPQSNIGHPGWRQTWSQYPGADPNSSNQPAISQYMDPNLTSTPYSTNQAASTPLM
jgi:signal transducing adaptor molecule